VVAAARIKTAVPNAWNTLQGERKWLNKRMSTIIDSGTFMNKQNASFIAKCTLIYALAYLIAGGIAYQLITKQFYVGDTPIFTQRI
jgi:hypothetical protein